MDVFGRQASKDLVKDGIKGYFYKDEQSMIIWKIGFTLDFGIIFLIPHLAVPRVTKTQAGGHIPCSNIKMGKSNSPTVFKIMLDFSSLYKILGLNQEKK